MKRTDEKGLETFQLWQRALEFSRLVCKDVLPLFTLSEKWAFANQMRRSVQSIPANITEGYGRYYNQEGVRFCYIAHGSLEETFSQLTLANRLEYIPETQLITLVSEIHELRRMLNGHISFLKTSKCGDNEPGVDCSVREPPIPLITGPGLESF
jgi:four helix bundle protein